MPAHFYAEVLAALRRMSVIGGRLNDAQAKTALTRLRAWPLHQVAVPSLLAPAWQYRHNLSAGDALYVALAARLDGSLLTDDHRLADAPNLPANVTFLRLPIQR